MGSGACSISKINNLFWPVAFLSVRLSATATVVHLNINPSDVQAHHQIRSVNWFSWTCSRLTTHQSYQLVWGLKGFKVLVSFADICDCDLREAGPRWDFIIIIFLKSYSDLFLFESQCANLSNSGAGCIKLITVSNVKKCSCFFDSCVFFCLNNNSGGGKNLVLFYFCLICSSLVFLVCIKVYANDGKWTWLLPLDRKSVV